MKEQAVEAAIEKIRRAPDAEWACFSGGDFAALREILGELWIGLDRETWEQYAFSTLSRQDIRDLLDLGRTTGGRAFSRAMIKKMDAILSHRRHSGDIP